MKLFFRFLLMLFPFMLMGCTYFSSPSMIRNKSNGYLAARSIPPLRIPPGVTSSTFHNEYPVSDRYYPESSKEISLIPPGLND